MKFTLEIEIPSLISNPNKRIVGCSKDLIIRGVENIYPKKVEDVFIEHHDVIDCHVVAVSSQRMGEGKGFYIEVGNIVNWFFDDISFSKVFSTNSNGT